MDQEPKESEGVSPYASIYRLLGLGCIIASVAFILVCVGLGLALRESQQAQEQRMRTVQKSEAPGNTQGHQQ